MAIDSRDDDLQPWFAGRETGVLLLFRVNRRPISQQSLFGEREPDILRHFESVLLFGEPVETGGKHKRVWRPGNRQIDWTRRVLAGQIGYERPDERPTDRYDEEQRAWIDAVDVVEATARAPFIFSSEDRILAVLRHPTFYEPTLPTVFSNLLNRGERRLLNPTTEWDVEALLDEMDFLDWLRSSESVQKVTFAAKLPNPDGEREFEPVWSRLQERKAKAIREIIEASDPDRGLDGVDRDPIARAFIAMAARGYGYVTGLRKNQNRIETYDQRNKGRRRYIGPLPATWAELILMIITFLREDREDGEGGSQ